MNADLEKLIALQELDLQIQHIRKSLQDYPDKVTSLETASQKTTQALATARAKVADLQAQKKALLEKIEHADQLLQRSNDRLNSITTNREYDAVHAEIESCKHIMAMASANQAHIDEEIAKADKAAAEIETEAEKITTENEPVITSLKQEMSSFDSQIAEITAKRETILPGLGRPYARAYEAIMKRRTQGGALSRVSNNSKICSACHKILESQLVNEIRKSTKLILCQNCGAIFYWDEAKPAE